MVLLARAEEPNPVAEAAFALAEAAQASPDKFTPEAIGEMAAGAARFISLAESAEELDETAFFADQAPMAFHAAGMAASGVAAAASVKLRQIAERKAEEKRRKKEAEEAAAKK